MKKLFNESVLTAEGSRDRLRWETPLLTDLGAVNLLTAGGSGVRAESNMNCMGRNQNRQRC